MCSPFGVEKPAGKPHAQSDCHCGYRLTTMLFTSLFTIALSINDGFQQSNFRQVGGFSHGGFKYMTQAQFDELKDDPLIGQWGERRYLGMPRERLSIKLMWR